MSATKVIFSLLYGASAALATYTFLLWPENTMFLMLLAGFGALSYQKPRLGLYLLLLLPVAGEFSRLQFLGKSIILSDLLIPLFEFSAILSIQKKTFDPKTAKIIKALILFLTVALISLVFNSTVLSLNELAQSSLYLIRLAFYLGLFPLSYLILKKSGDHKAFLLWMTVSALLIAIGGYIQLQFLPNLEFLAKTEGYDPHINRLVGSWLDPNFIGGFFAFIIVLLCSVALYSKSRQLQTLFFASSVIFSIALFLTYSRSAYLAFLAGILILGVVKARRLLFIILIVGAIGLAGSDRAQQRVGELVTSMTSVLFNTAENPDPTARLRLQNWEQTLELIGEKPILGHGYNTLSFIKLEKGYIKNQEVHSASGSDSSLLTIMATTGIIGLSAFLSILYLSLKRAFQNWLGNYDNLTKGLGLGLICGIVSLIIHSNFVNSLLFPQIMIFFWPLLGLLYSASTNK